MSLSERRIAVCCGGRDLEFGSAEALSVPAAALEAWKPTHVIHGAQAGGDEIWHALAQAVKCQVIRVFPSNAMLSPEAFADRTCLLWEIADCLGIGPRSLACFALTGGRGTALCISKARHAGAQIHQFDWPRRKKS